MARDPLLDKWCFASLQVGNRNDSNLYISMKLKAAVEVKRSSVGIQYVHHAPCYCTLFVLNSDIISTSVYTDRNKCHTHETSQHCHRGGGEVTHSKTHKTLNYMATGFKTKWQEEPESVKESVSLSAGTSQDKRGERELFHPWSHRAAALGLHPQDWHGEGHQCRGSRERCRWVGAES